LFQTVTLKIVIYFPQCNYLNNHHHCPLGIETGEDNMMTCILKRNTAVPAKKSKIFTTGRDNQTGVPIVVYEGERAMSKDNTAMGRFDLNGISKAPRGTVRKWFLLI
jgi:molecular chaperone DnaK (HSP70)